MIEFFIQMKLPTVTHQQKKVHVVNGKPHYYEPDALKDARQKLVRTWQLMYLKKS